MLAASIWLPMFVKMRMGRNICTQSFETSLAEESVIRPSREARRPYARVMRTEREAWREPRKVTERGLGESIGRYFGEVGKLRY